MDAWVQRALAKWPDVPALFGWLGLDRRGHWLIQGERISHARIVDVIGRNYGVDAHGRWFFQNGPQRGYIALEYAPRVLRVQADDRLLDQTGRQILQARALFVDEHGSATLDTSEGAALLDGADLDWVLERLRHSGEPAADEALATALAAAHGTHTVLTLAAFGAELPVIRCDADALGATLGFVRDPQPLPGDPGP